MYCLSEGVRELGSSGGENIFGTENLIILFKHSF